jgi:TRAP-type C4-dicarboxylate transport system permease small subunit
MDPEASPNGVMHVLVVVLRTISATALFMMAALTFVDVVGRYFNAPIFGAAEMVQYLLALTVFAGLGLASVSNSHVTVDIFDGWLMRRVPVARRVLLWTCNVIAFGLIAWQLGRLGIAGIRHDRRSIVLEWPEAWLIVLLAILASVALVLELAGWREAPDPIDTQEEVI